VSQRDEHPRQARGDRQLLMGASRLVAHNPLSQYPGWYARHCRLLITDSQRKLSGGEDFHGSCEGERLGWTRDMSFPRYRGVCGQSFYANEIRMKEVQTSMNIPSSYLQHGGNSAKASHNPSKYSPRPASPPLVAADSGPSHGPESKLDLGSHQQQISTPDAKLPESTQKDPILPFGDTSINAPIIDPAGEISLGNDAESPSNVPISNKEPANSLLAMMRFCWKILQAATTTLPAMTRSQIQRLRTYTTGLAMMKLQPMASF